MTLKVIGTGLGRTGTKSLQTALNMLGFGPCHHMMEFFAHRETAPLWVEAGAGRPDWEKIYADYRSTVDYPGASFWRELCAYYPDAKVIHTVRDPEKWFASTQATIFSPDGLSARETPLTPFFNAVLGEFHAFRNERAPMIEYFHRHNAEVLRTIAPERLLVYEVKEGWDPLCRFLGVKVPDAPFPSENSTADFIGRGRNLHAGAPS